MFHLLDHPLIQHKISVLRNQDTGCKEFRELVDEISMLMGYEVTRDLPLEYVDIQTPVALAHAPVLSGKKIAIVPILRAGLGMVDGMLRLLPAARVGHVGMYRNPKTLEPVPYYCKLPKDIDKRIIVVLDPMLATGGTASATIAHIKELGGKDIRLVSIVAAPMGVEKVTSDHPDVEVYAGALDEKLNDHGYIVPGLGDAGDRIFGTK